MAAALGPPEVIAQLENAAKVLMVSAPPRPSLHACLVLPGRLGAHEGGGGVAWYGSLMPLSCCSTPSWGCLSRDVWLPDEGFSGRRVHRTVCIRGAGAEGGRPGLELLVPLVPRVPKCFSGPVAALGPLHLQHVEWWQREGGDSLGPRTLGPNFGTPSGSRVHFILTRHIKQLNEWVIHPGSLGRIKGKKGFLAGGSQDKLYTFTC